MESIYVFKQPQILLNVSALKGSFTLSILKCVFAPRPLKTVRFQCPRLGPRLPKRIAIFDVQIRLKMHQTIFTAFVSQSDRL